ncbi:MAG TPA: ABC transporter substrate-binding protein [Chloroflexia bacterium]|nr:ABC transporter substrate-binding protein [Chloroflexia bacterium]
MFTKSGLIIKQTPRSKLSLLLVLLMLLALSLSACSDAGGLSQPTVAQPPAAVQSGNQAPPANPNPAGAANITGLPYDCSKIFCFGLAQEPVGLLQNNFVFDPANLVDRSSLQITRQVYETLFEFKPDSMQYQYSSLLKYEPKVSEDGLTYTLRLGKGLRFSDNTPLDAAAIKFNFDRWSDPGNRFHKGDFSTWSYYFGGFPGKLSSVTADQDNNLVTIKLKQPMGNFFQVLSMPQFGIVAPSAFNTNSGEMEHSTGSGRYLIEKVVRSDNKYVVLRENQMYYFQRYDPADPNKPTVKSNTIVALVLKQNQDGLDELRKGAISATDKIKPEEVPNATKDPAFKLLDRNPLSIAFLGMNQTRPPFNNLLVRQAFAAAIDTNALVRDYYFGLGEPASVLLPPTSLAQIDTHDPYEYDPDQARRLLDTAGYNLSNPLKLDLWVLPVPRAYYPDPKKIADAIASYLQKVGVQVTVRDSYAWPDFYKARQAGTMDFYMFGWQGQNGDPDEFLGEFFGKPSGEGGYENPVLTGLIQDGLKDSDLRNRRDYYRQAQDIIYDQLPVLPLAYVKGVVAIRPNVVGYVAHPTGIENWSSVGLANK